MTLSEGRRKPEKALGTEIPASPLTIADGIDFRHGHETVMAVLSPQVRDQGGEGT